MGYCLDNRQKFLDRESHRHLRLHAVVVGEVHDPLAQVPVRGGAIGELGQRQDHSERGRMIANFALSMMTRPWTPSPPSTARQ